MHLGEEGYLAITRDIMQVLLLQFRMSPCLITCILVMILKTLRQLCLLICMLATIVRCMLAITWRWVSKLIGTGRQAYVLHTSVLSCA